MAISWHVYCLVVDDDTSLPMRSLCSLWDEIDYLEKMKGVQNLGMPGIITEFGAVPNDNASVENLQVQMRVFGQNSYSYMYWAFKDFSDITTANPSNSNDNEGIYFRNGSLQLQKAKVLLYPYFSSISGIPLSQIFDFAENTLIFKFVTGSVGQSSKLIIPDIWKREFVGETDFVPDGVQLKRDDNILLLLNLK